MTSKGQKYHEMKGDGKRHVYCTTLHGEGLRDQGMKKRRFMDVEGHR